MVEISRIWKKHLDFPAVEFGQRIDSSTLYDPSGQLFKEFGTSEEREFLIPEKNPKCCFNKCVAGRKFYRQQNTFLKEQASQVYNAPKTSFLTQLLAYIEPTGKCPVRGVQYPGLL